MDKEEENIDKKEEIGVAEVKEAVEEKKDIEKKKEEDNDDDKDENENDEKTIEGGVKLTAGQKKRLRKKNKKAAEANKNETTPSSSSSSSSSSSATVTTIATPAITPATTVQPKKKQGNDQPILDYSSQSKQTNPPSIPLSQLFGPKHVFPLGQCFPHRDEETMHRSTDPRNNKIEQINAQTYNDFRQAAECHRELRAYARTILKPGINLYDFCTEVENKGRFLLGQDTVNHIYSGMAFPTGVSINNCAAHYTPNPGDPRVLLKDDIIKVDIGTHYHGHVIDSAFSAAFDGHGTYYDRYKKAEAGSIFEPLIEASYQATWNAVNFAGIDVRLCDVGELIEEIIRSYEMEGSPIPDSQKGTITNPNRRIKPIQPIKNLSGHQLDSFVVHAGKTVPLIKNGCAPNIRMEENDLFAIETFASTGKGSVSDTTDCSHYMLRRENLPTDAFKFLQDPLLTSTDIRKASSSSGKDGSGGVVANYSSFAMPRIRDGKARQLFHHIHARFRTLAWCKRWLDQSGMKTHAMQLKHLVDAEVVDPYPPLVDTEGSFVSQHEHTFILKPTAKEIFSAGGDYSWKDENLKTKK